MAAALKTDAEKLQDAAEILRKKNAELIDHKRTIEQLRRDNDTAEAIRQEIFGLAAHSCSPPEWVSGKGTKLGSRGGPVTIWSDFHYGEVVNPDEVGGVNEFNLKIARTRIKRLVDTTIDLCSNHMGRSNVAYPGIVVCLGGDMIGGDIHEELLATNDRTSHQSVHDLVDLVGAGLETMAGKFGRVFVPCVVGNHGRSTHKPRMKQRVFTNYDWSLYCSLERDFRKDKRVKFLVPSESDARFDVYGHRYLLSHGDSLGVRGGDGIIGALGPIMRGSIKTGRSEAQIGRNYDTLVIGHWHQYLTLPGLIVNNSLKGYDEYSRLQLRAPYSRPSQALWFSHPEHGITAHWQVYLEGQRTAAAEHRVGQLGRIMPGINFEAPPTCASFMKSEAFGRLIAGPVGSGKTTACVIELLRRSINQSPGQDGISHTRFAIVRQTLKQLKDTVLKDCKSWLGGLGDWKVSENTFHLNFDRIQSEWIFIPLEDAEDQARLLSMQLTGAWLSECIEMDISVLGPISGRLGRYPSAAQGAPTWFGMIADTNMPTEMTPWHTFMESLPPNWQKFVQPSGVAYNAENLNFLVQTEATMKLPIDHPDRLAQGRKYYERFIETYGDDSDWVKRYVYAQYGDDPSGLAVFRQSFKSSFHVVDDTLVIPGYPLIIAQDFGRNPWSLICQVDHMGRLLVHEEVPATNIGLEKHVNEHLRPRLFQEKYVNAKVIVVGDPSGVAKGNVGEESCFDALKRFGMSAFPAPTNAIEPRLRAVEALLGRHVNGGPALMISKRGCPWLVRAMSGGYRFTKTKQGALRTVPEKNDKEGFSHVADDLQYAALVVHGGLVHEFARRLTPRTTTNRPKFTSAAWT